ncbi:capZ-interacting protein isoform X3 [Ahaetulla prasina]|uniref:capZ-interacting protein isoform X3 n=1 Tax=Ahaetulla prasina TaxID=499056 RepID=UPI0026487E91|nr:capZ-interacting protein isoform X3 [Ahaetulla prasina]
MGEEILPKTIPHLHNREAEKQFISAFHQDKPSETKMVVEKPTTPSVAQLAGKFQEKSSVSGKEVPAPKPARRKPPCSLPLHTNKMELGQNGELKPSPNASRPIRIKPKSSPLIEKMQVRTRGSIKRRPPSRRFRKSQSEYGDDLDLGGTVLPQENGSKTEEKEEVDVFMDKNKCMKSSPAPEGGVDHQKKQNQVASDEKSPSVLQSSGSENKEKEVDTEKVTKFKESQEDKTQQNLSEERPSKTVNNEKEKNADTNTAEDTKRKPWNCNASNMENTYKEKREEKINGSEDSHHESSRPDIGTSQPTGDMKLF